MSAAGTISALCRNAAVGLTRALNVETAEEVELPLVAGIRDSGHARSVREDTRARGEQPRRSFPKLITDEIPNWAQVVIGAAGLRMRTWHDRCEP